MSEQEIITRAKEAYTLAFQHEPDVYPAWDKLTPQSQSQWIRTAKIVENSNRRSAGLPSVFTIPTDAEITNNDVVL